MTRSIGYARVSTVDQDPALQHDALTAAGCVEVYSDVASGALAARPQLDYCLSRLQAGDTLVVWRLDRLGRSLRHLLDLVQRLQHREVRLRSLQESIDTGSASGRLVLSLFGALAEFERELIRERTLAGLSAARARGRLGGRKTVMGPRRLALARQLYDAREHTLTEIAAMLGVSRSSVVRALARERRPAPTG